MTDPAWAEGYVVDIGYTHGYYRELAPSALRFVALLAGLEVARGEEPFTCYELGCGNGYSLTVHGAANPLGEFIGVDFNPTHIHNARQLAADGGVANVRFLEKSFGELLELDLPDADIIELHGVWSWVGEEHRRQIVELIRRRLKPAGIAYVSYNCLPGLASVSPLQRLLVEHTELGAGERVERVRRALDFASRLDGAGAEFFRANPVAKVRLAGVADYDPRYIAHEYFNANWSLFYHADVARTLGSAKLGYAGSADYVQNFSQFVLKPEIAEIVAEVGDRAFAETLKDYASNQVFRKDVFTRGAPAADAAAREAILGSTRFALARPRSLCRLQGRTPVGEVTLQPESYAPVLDALARAPMTFDELAQAPETAGLGRTRLRQGVFGMAALGNVWPALPAAGDAARRAAVRRLNEVLLRQKRPGAATTVLASPVVGAGVALGAVDRICFATPQDEPGAIERAKRAVAAGGQKLVKDGQAVEPGRATDAAVEEQARFFFRELLPFYRQLGVID
ncbi:MAG TPA: class I SAM-dependent methyltransferase [Burkholderiales bacterium]|nr:class I SAM-dependent methyltransferase [Burkholderiales bacterium]